MQEQTRRQTIMKLAPWIMVLVVLAFLSTAAIGGYVFEKDWTGVNESTQTKKATQDVRPEKTLWDWLQLLIVPVTVAGAGIWFNWAQRSRELEVEQQRRQSDLEVEDQ